MEDADVIVDLRARLVAAERARDEAIAARDEQAGSHLMSVMRLDLEVETWIDRSKELAQLLVEVCGMAKKRRTAFYDDEWRSQLRRLDEIERVVKDKC